MCSLRCRHRAHVLTETHAHSAARDSAPVHTHVNPRRDAGTRVWGTHTCTRVCCTHTHVHPAQRSRHPRTTPDMRAHTACADGIPVAESSRVPCVPVKQLVCHDKGGLAQGRGSVASSCLPPSPMADRRPLREQAGRVTAPFTGFGDGSAVSRVGPFS